MSLVDLSSSKLAGQGSKAWLALPPFDVFPRSQTPVWERTCPGSSASFICLAPDLDLRDRPSWGRWLRSQAQLENELNEGGLREPALKGHKVHKFFPFPAFLRE